MRNAVGDLLEGVVEDGTTVEVGLINPLLHKLGSSTLRAIDLEARAKTLDGLAAETGQTRLQHQSNHLTDLLSVRARGQVSLNTELTEPAVALVLDTGTH